MAYATSFKNQMIEKIFEPGGLSLTVLAQESGVSATTLYAWRKEALEGDEMTDQSDSRQGPRRRRKRSPKEKIRIVMEAAALSEDELGSFLREKGLYDADLARLQQEVMEAAEKGFGSGKKKKGPSKAEKELKVVQKELARKEKALAETAALLVLRGKLEAFLLGDEEGDTRDKNES